MKKPDMNHVILVFTLILLAVAALAAWIDVIQGWLQ